jgi:signal transduction histidine kinase
LDGVSLAMRDMAAEADLIFAHFRQGQTDRAGERMATMDRKYARLIAELAGLSGQVRDIQRHHFREQVAAAEYLRRFEYLIGGSIVLMVAGVTIYGHKIARKVRADEEKLERYATGLAKARDEAEEASRAKSTFLANMSHELRTPLNAIIGYSEILLEEAEDLGQDGLKPDVEKIRGAGRHLLGLINDILDLSKIEAGKMDLFVEEFDVAAVLKDVARRSSRSWPGTATRSRCATRPTSARCARTRSRSARPCSTCSATPPSSPRRAGSRSRPDGSPGRTGTGWSSGSPTPASA